MLMSSVLLAPDVIVHFPVPDLTMSPAPVVGANEPEMTPSPEPLKVSERSVPVAVNAPP